MKKSIKNYIALTIALLVSFAFIIGSICMMLWMGIGLVKAFLIMSIPMCIFCELAEKHFEITIGFFTND